MIVTCPGCAAKYRVRDESVPRGGAELKCPTCSAVFVAHPPKHSEEEIHSALERATRAKESAEARLAELTSARAAVDERAADAERRAREADARLAQAEASILVLKSELDGSRTALEAEVARWRDEAARAVARANAAAAAEHRVLTLTEELARARAVSDRTPELNRVNDELAAAQRGAGRLRTELESALQNVSALQSELVRTQERLREGDQAEERADALAAELSRLREQMASAATVPPGAALSPQLGALIHAVTPMLWGLEQAIKYLEPFAGSEPALAGHVRQLQLLHGVLTRLSAEAQAR